MNMLFFRRGLAGPGGKGQKVLYFLLRKPTMSLKSMLLSASGVAVALGTSLLTVTSTGVTVEAADVTNVSTANGYYLTSSFEILDFIPTLAVLAGGMYVLNKIFSFVPGSRA